MPFTSWPEFGTWLLGAPLLVVLTVVLALIARWLTHRAIRSMVDTAVKRADEKRVSTGERLLGVDAERRRQRALTMGSLLKSVAPSTGRGRSPGVEDLRRFGLQDLVFRLVD